MTSTALPAGVERRLDREFLGLVLNDHERKPTALLRHVLDANFGRAQSIADLDHAQRHDAADPGDQLLNHSG